MNAIEGLPPRCHLSPYKKQPTIKTRFHVPYSKRRHCQFQVHLLTPSPGLLNRRYSMPMTTSYEYGWMFPFELSLHLRTHCCSRTSYTNKGTESSVKQSGQQSVQSMIWRTHDRDFMSLLSYKPSALCLPHMLLNVCDFTNETRG